MLPHYHVLSKKYVVQGMNAAVLPISSYFESSDDILSNDLSMLILHQAQINLFIFI
jgi:hypothetical protein